MKVKILCMVIWIFIICTYTGDSISSALGIQHRAIAAYSWSVLERPGSKWMQGYFKYLAEIYSDDYMIQAAARYEDLIMVIVTLVLLAYISISLQTKRPAEIKGRVCKIFEQFKGFKFK